MNIPGLTLGALQAPQRGGATFSAPTPQTGTSLLSAPQQGINGFTQQGNAFGATAQGGPVDMQQMEQMLQQIKEQTLKAEIAKLELKQQQFSAQGKNDEAQALQPEINHLKTELAQLQSGQGNGSPQAAQGPAPAGGAAPSAAAAPPAASAPPSGGEAPTAAPSAGAEQAQSTSDKVLELMAKVLERIFEKTIDSSIAEKTEAEKTNDDKKSDEAKDTDSDTKNTDKDTSTDDTKATPATEAPASNTTKKVTVKQNQAA